MNQFGIPQLNLKANAATTENAEDKPLTSPKQESRSAPQSPRFIPVDSPRPSDATVKRRLSQNHSMLKQSPLRNSLSETSLQQHIDAMHKQNAEKQTAETVSKTETKLIEKQASSSDDEDDDNSNEDDEKIQFEEQSPLMGRLETYINPFFLLEEVFRTPGGGIESRSVLGIYTSKRAAFTAGRTYLHTTGEHSEHFEHMSLKITPVSVDKVASKNHDAQAEHL